MREKEKWEIIVNEGEQNSLVLREADEDGFHICETEESKDKAYVYHSEVDNLINALRRTRF